MYRSPRFFFHCFTRTRTALIYKRSDKLCVSNSVLMSRSLLFFFLEKTALRLALGRFNTAIRASQHKSRNRSTWRKLPIVCSSDRDMHAPKGKELWPESLLQRASDSASSTIFSSASPTLTPSPELRLFFFLDQHR